MNSTDVVVERASRVTDMLGTAGELCVELALPQYLAIAMFEWARAVAVDCVMRVWRVVRVGVRCLWSDTRGQIIYGQPMQTPNRDTLSGGQELGD